MARTLDEKLEDALREAASEAKESGHPMAARAFDELRMSVLQWRVNALERIKQLGLVTLDDTQREELMTMLAREMVSKIMAEKRQKSNEAALAFWTTRGAKFGLVLTALSLTVTMFAAIYNLLFGAAHPIHFGG